MTTRPLRLGLISGLLLAVPSAARGDLAAADRACDQARALWDGHRPDEARRRLDAALHDCRADRRCQARVQLALAELAVIGGDLSRAGACEELGARLRGHAPADASAKRCAAAAAAAKARLASRPAMRPQPPAATAGGSAKAAAKPPAGVLLRATPTSSATAPVPDVARLRAEAAERVERGDAGGALARLDEAVRVADRQEHAPSQALALASRGVVRSKAGQRDAAARDLERAAALYRDVGDVPGEAKALRLAGNARLAQARPEEARAAYQQALPLQRAAGSRRGEAAALSGLSAALLAEAPGAAAFTGKLAASRYATTGGPRFARPVVEAHRRPAEALLAAGRPGEALELMVRLERLRVGTARGRPAADLPPIELTEREQRYAREYERIVGEVAAAERAYAAAVQRAAEGGSADEVERARRERERARDRFDRFLKRMEKDVGGEDALGARRLRSVQAALAKLGPDTAAVFTFVGDRRIWLVLVTPDEVTGHSARIRRGELHDRVKALRAALQDTRVDPRPAAADLHDVLVRPIRAELDRRSASTVMWWLDEWLRYVPPHALWDRHREQWFVERAASTVFNLSSVFQLTEERPEAWAVLAAGVSAPPPGFQPLFGVPVELAAIAREADGEPGVLAGRRLLDAQFTRDTFEAGLAEGRPVVHVASHYVLSPPPGDDVEDDLAEEVEDGEAAGPARDPSFLLLGDGSRFTIGDLDALPAETLRKVDLLVLSACETGIGADAEDPTATLDEVDGFASAAQERGVRSVLASLWRVSDASTPALMRTFYAARGGKDGPSKAAALRTAQLAMLRGELAPPDGAAAHACGARGVSLADAPAALASWTHPCHWAPFVIAGNWR